MRHSCHSIWQIFIAKDMTQQIQIQPLTSLILQHLSLLHSVAFVNLPLPMAALLILMLLLLSTNWIYISCCYKFQILLRDIVCGAQWTSTDKSFRRKSMSFLYTLAKRRILRNKNTEDKVFCGIVLSFLVSQRTDRELGKSLMSLCSGWLWSAHTSITSLWWIIRCR